MTDRKGFSYSNRRKTRYGLIDDGFLWLGQVADRSAKAGGSRQASPARPEPGRAWVSWPRPTSLEPGLSWAFATVSTSGSLRSETDHAPALAF